MLQAKDLRIGNYIADKWIGGNIPFKITSIGKTTCTYKSIRGFRCGYGSLQPIPLTEEILKNNFGFKKIYKIGNKKYFEHSEYRISFTVVDNCFVFDFGPTTIGQREYVHEVQNLFKELTQKEIEINL